MNDDKAIAAIPRLLKAIKAVVDEVDGDFAPYSLDSYLPQHLVDQLRSAYRAATGVDI